MLFCPFPPFPFAYLLPPSLLQPVLGSCASYKSVLAEQASAYGGCFTNGCCSRADQVLSCRVFFFPVLFPPFPQLAAVPFVLKAASGANQCGGSEG